MKKFRNKIIALCLMLTAICFTSVFSAYAVDSQSGSFTIKVCPEAESAELTLYNIADYKNSEYFLNNDFSSANVDLNSLKNSDDAAKAIDSLQKYISKNPSIKGISTKIDSNGVAVFSGLDINKAYLAVQTYGQDTVEIQGTFVTIPYLNDGEYEYDVSAVAKYEIVSPSSDHRSDPSDESSPQGSSVSQSTDTESSEPPSNPVLTGDDAAKYIIIGVAVAVSLAVIIVLVVSSGKKKKK
ncbi:MAG: hypothetical protein PUG48_03820 [Clostridia bacterium]|nr:hypothetical protein [Clostridia bacterium]